VSGQDILDMISPSPAEISAALSLLGAEQVAPGVWTAELSIGVTIRIADPTVTTTALVPVTPPATRRRRWTSLPRPYQVAAAVLLLLVLATLAVLAWQVASWFALIGAAICLAPVLVDEARRCLRRWRLTRSSTSRAGGDRR
jgi:hypothetical protein